MIEWGGRMVAVGCLFMSVGCASIVDGRRETVSFSSDPPGAEIVINGKSMGVTPASIVLERSDYGSATVLFKKEGYQEQQAAMSTGVNMWFWGNIIFGGLVGSSTDLATGAVWKFSPNSYHVSMPPVQASQAEWDQYVYERSVRRFILFSHSQLVSDAAKGGGEHLSSLYQLLSVHRDEQQEALSRIRHIAFSVDTAPGFANAVMDTFKDGGMRANGAKNGSLFVQ